VQTFLQLQAGLTSLFADLSGVPALASRAVDADFTFPADEDTDQAGGPVELTFSIDGTHALGRDEIRQDYRPGTYDAGDGDEPLEIEGDTYEPDPDNPELRLGGIVFTACGNRVVTITIRVESHDQTHPAWEYAERLRSKLALPSSRARLYALDLARQSVSELKNLSYDGDDGRPVSAYALELICNAASNVADEPVTTIERVDVRRGSIGQ
jgi:hypothetical protein